MREKIFDFFSFASSRFPITTLVITFIIFLLAMNAASNVKYAQGYDTYFSKEHKEFKQYKLFSKDFGTTMASVYIFIKGDDVVNYETFEFMLKLGKALSAIDGVGEVKSPAHSIYNRLGYLPSDESELSELAFEYGSFYLPKKSFALMELEITAPQDKFETLSKEIERKIAFYPPPPGVTVEATGNPMIRYQVTQSIKGSMETMGIAAVILMVSILVIVFREVVTSKKYLLLPLLISILTATMAFGLMPVLGIPLTETTNAFFPVLIGLSIEYAAQFQSRYEEERRNGITPVQAATAAVKSVGVALSLAMITTVIGFLSMVFSGVPSLSWFGILSAIGLVIAYILSLTFLPSILVITDRTDREKVRVRKPGITDKGLKAAARTARHPSAVLVLTLLVIVAGFYGYSNVSLQTDFFKYIPQDLPAMRKFNELQRLVGSQDRIIAVFETDGVDFDTVNEINGLAKYVTSSEPRITRYSDLTTLFMRFGKLPENEEEFQKFMELLPEDNIKRYVAGSTMAVYFTVAPMDWLEFRKLYDRVREEIDFYGTGYGYYLTGDVVLKMFVADLIVNGQNRMTIASFILVFLLLLVVYRSVSRAVVPLLPITTVIAVTGGVMYLFGIERTLISASLNSLTIGLGIDFSIHVMERYLEERRRGLSPEKAVEVTVENIGKAILTSGLTMAGGFAAMLVSPFPIMANFGMVSVLAIVFSLIAALTIVPAFLVFTERFNSRINTKLNSLREKQKSEAA